jgi:hypothetical protein
MKKSVNKWTREDFDWYWRDRFADVDSPDYSERHNWRELTRCGGWTWILAKGS